MASTTNYLAYDLGASSGRAVLGRFDGARLDIEEVHRFPNQGIPIGNHYYWDALRLFDEMCTGLRLAVRSGEPLNGMGCDTWGSIMACSTRRTICSAIPFVTAMRAHRG